jgi:hypothetical protein
MTRTSDATLPFPAAVLQATANSPWQAWQIPTAGEGKPSAAVSLKALKPEAKPLSSGSKTPLNIRSRSLLLLRIPLSPATVNSTANKLSSASRLIRRIFIENRVNQSLIVSLLLLVY